MAAQDILLQLRLRGQKATQAGLKDTAKATDSIGSSARRTARNVALAGGAAIGLTKALYDVGATFDDAFDTLRVQTGATGGELAGLQADFRKVVSTVPADFATASEAIGQLSSRLGIAGRPLQALSAQFLELSRITKTDLSGNIASVTRAFGDWDVAANQQAATLDRFFRASQASGTGVQDLAGQVVKFGAPLRQLGFGLNESIAMFASFEKAGVNTQTLMPGLRRALSSFLEAGRDPGSALRETFRGVQSGAISTASAIKIFGQRAGGDMVEAIRQGRFQLDGLTKSMASGDTIMGAAKDTRDLSEAWQLFKNRALLKIEPVAVRVFALLGAGMNKLPGQIEPATSAIGRLVGFLVRNKDIIIALGAGLASYLVLTKTWAVTSAVAAFATGGWTTAFWALNAAMAANPVGLVIVGIAALVAGLTLAYKRSATVRGVLNSVWGVMKSTFGWVTKNWPLLAGILTAGVVPAIKAIVGNFGAIKGAARSAINAVISIFNAGIGLINSLIPDQISLPGPLPDINLSGLNIPKIPALASGGVIARGGAALVGERGPEVVQLPTRARVHDAQASAGMLGGGADLARLAAAIESLARRPLIGVTQIDGREIARATFRQVADEEAFS